MQFVNETYKTNLQRLENFVMVKFIKDTIVQPIESEWFGFYKENDIKSTYSLQESVLYLEVIVDFAAVFIDVLKASVSIPYRIGWVCKVWTSKENCISMK